MLEFKKMFPICVGLLEEEIEKVSNQIEASSGTAMPQMEEHTPFSSAVNLFHYLQEVFSKSGETPCDFFQKDLYPRGGLP